MTVLEGTPLCLSVGKPDFAGLDLGHLKTLVAHERFPFCGTVAFLMVSDLDFPNFLLAHVLYRSSLPTYLSQILL